jgi:hypothetical protein
MSRLQKIALALTLLAPLSAVPATADLIESRGKVTFLRVHDVGTGFGPPSDFIDVDVVVQLEREIAGAPPGPALDARRISMPRSVLRVTERGHRAFAARVPPPRSRAIAGFRKAWRVACGKAKASATLFHDLRRSGIRNLVRAGVAIAVAAPD